VVTDALLRSHRRILIDTSVWIYHLEGSEEFARPAGSVLEAVESGRIQGLASELTLLELLVRPLALRRQDVADHYELLLDQFPNLELVPADRAVLVEAAALRARHRLRTPDAIVLATGLLHGATLAVTNDEAWRAVGRFEVLLLSDL
jgi:predicted nucleic acid-binding protein